MYFWNGRNNLLEADNSSGAGKRKTKGTGKSKETAASLFQFYGTVTLNTAPISEGSFFETYYLERLVVFTRFQNWKLFALLPTSTTLHIFTAMCTHLDQVSACRYHEIFGECVPECQVSSFPTITPPCAEGIPTCCIQHERT